MYTLYVIYKLGFLESGLEILSLMKRKYFTPKSKVPDEFIKWAPKLGDETTEELPFDIYVPKPDKDKYPKIVLPGWIGYVFWNRRFINSIRELTFWSKIPLSKIKDHTISYGQIIIKIPGTVFFSLKKLISRQPDPEKINMLELITEILDKYEENI